MDLIRSQKTSNSNSASMKSSEIRPHNNKKRKEIKPNDYFSLSSPVFKIVHVYDRAHLNLPLIPSDCTEEKINC